MSTFVFSFVYSAAPLPGDAVGKCIFSSLSEFISGKSGSSISASISLSLSRRLPTSSTTIALYYRVRAAA